MDLTHFDQDGNAWMVDVSDKDITSRTAIAEGFIAINDAIYERIAAGTITRPLRYVPSLRLLEKRALKWRPLQLYKWDCSPYTICVRPSIKA